jgi:hypothetical protein
MGIHQVSWKQMKKAYACALGQLTWSWFRIFGKMEDSLVSIFFLNFKN